MSETPDTIHGRMKEGAHLAAYSVARVIDNLKYLLTDAKFMELSAGYKDVNEFLRDTQTPFEKLKISPEERKEIAQLVKGLQPEASQRAIADMVGVSDVQVGRDLGKDYGATNVAQDTVEAPEIATNVAPQPWTADDDFEPEAPSRRSEGWYQTSKSPVYETPHWLFGLLDDELHFETDVCALPENAKCERFYSPEQNGLLQKWEGACWMNPPYGAEIKDWMQKARASANMGATVACLVPARTDTEWWWDNAIGSEIRFIKGRLTFEGAPGPAPFPSAVIIMRPDKSEKVVWWNIQEAR